MDEALGGTDALNQLASKLGVSASSAASAAGFLLPRVIGYLTPEGKVPDHLPNEVHEFIRHHALAKVEEAPRRETYETPRRETYETPRRETYETPRREVVHEAPRRETYVAPPRRVEPVHEQDEQSWFWWALPLIGLALLAPMRRSLARQSGSPGCTRLP